MSLSFGYSGARRRNIRCLALGLFFLNSLLQLRPRGDLQAFESRCDWGVCRSRVSAPTTGQFVLLILLNHQAI